MLIILSVHPESLMYLRVCVCGGAYLFEWMGMN